MSKQTYKFEVIPLNLQQGMIRATGLGDNVLNQVAAIYSYHLNLLMVRVDWRDELEAIRTVCPVENFTTQFADSFHVDTWDGRLDKIGRKRAGIV